MLGILFTGGSSPAKKHNIHYNLYYVKNYENKHFKDYFHLHGVNSFRLHKHKGFTLNKSSRNLKKNKKYIKDDGSIFINNSLMNRYIKNCRRFYKMW